MVANLRMLTPLKLQGPCLGVWQTVKAKRIKRMPEWDGRKKRDCAHSVFVGKVRHAREVAGRADET